MSDEERKVPQLQKYVEDEEKKSLTTADVSPFHPPEKNKLRSLVLAGVIGGLVTACVGLGIYRFAYTDQGYLVKDAQEVMQETTNPKLKASSTDNKSVYQISNASDTMNGLTLSIEGIQFRRDQTRLWVHLRNNGQRDVSAIALGSAKLVDDEGHQYSADPFAGWNAGQIPVGMDETVMLVFDPIRINAGKLSLSVDGFSNMKDPNWNEVIDFEIPN